jgi:hypothetical protein
MIERGAGAIKELLMSEPLMRLLGDPTNAHGLARVCLAAALAAATPETALAAEWLCDYRTDLLDTKAIVALAGRAAAAGKIKPGDEEFPGNDAADYLATRLKDFVRGDGKGPFAALLVQHALSRIDWRAVAESLLAESGS